MSQTWDALIKTHNKDNLKKLTIFSLNSVDP